MYCISAWNFISTCQFKQTLHIFKMICNGSQLFMNNTLSVCCVSCHNIINIFIRGLRLFHVSISWHHHGALWFHDQECTSIQISMFAWNMALLILLINFCTVPQNLYSFINIIQSCNHITQKIFALTVHCFSRFQYVSSHVIPYYWQS